MLFDKESNYHQQKWVNKNKPQKNFDNNLCD